MRFHLPLYRTKTLALVAFLSTLATSSIASQEHDHDEHVSLGAHVHGEAELFVVHAGGQLLIELESPAMNLVGFEHRPHNEEQRHQFAQASQQLLAVDKLFVIQGGDCQLKEQHVEMPFSNELDHDSHADHAPHKDHDSHKDHDHHEDHESESSHSDVLAEYDFECADSANLKGIELNIFERFPAMQKVNAQWASQGGQNARTLTAEDAYIQLQ